MMEFMTCTFGATNGENISGFIILHSLRHKCTVNHGLHALSNRFDCALYHHI